MGSFGDLLQQETDNVFKYFYGFQVFIIYHTSALQQHPPLDY